MIDKLYIMLPEFKVQRNYDIRTAWDNFYTDPANKDIQDEIKRNLEFGLEDYKAKHPDDIDLNIDDYFDFIKSHGVKKYQLSENAQKRFSTWFKARKADYFIGTNVKKIEYDYDKSPQEQSLRARNNALIDMMWGVLTSPDTASKIITPGGFDKQKVAARVVTILDSMTEKEMSDAGYTIKSLLKMSYDSSSLDILDKLAEEAKKKLDPLSPRTQVIFHQQNMTGGKMIGIYANHNAHHALMQHTKLAIDDVNGSFNYAGIKRTSLHDMKNERGELISRNTANFLAASVDNVKDNTLHATNQNTFTGDPSMLLSRLGYNPTEIAILMRQPIVMEITKKYFREYKEGKSKGTIIDEVISDTVKYADMYEDISWLNVQNNPYNLEDLMRDIQLYKEVPSMSKRDRVEFYRRQVTVGLLFKRIMNSADVLGDLVNTSKADTPNGAAGPTIADTMLKLQRLDEFLYKVYTDRKFPLIYADILKTGIRYDGDVDSLRKDILENPLSFLQAFYTLGLEQTEGMLKKYFPQFSEPFKDVFNGYNDELGNAIHKGFRQMTKPGGLNAKTINSIYNDLLAYIMSKTDFFGTTMTKDGNIVSSSEKRRYYINDFPADFTKIISENEDIAELEFIKRLRVIKSGYKNPVDIIIFKNVGQLSPNLRENYMNDWASLLYMKNPKANRLALDLILYSYYRNGFAFGPSTFTHLVPLAVRTAIPDYIPTLRSLLTTKDDYREFVEQYIYNHLDNRKFVPEIPSSASVSFTDEKGNLMDEIEIIIDSYSKDNEAAVRVKNTDMDGITTYDFFNFIARNHKGKYVYYKLSGMPNPITATYTRIEPLGYKNNFLEYEFGKEASEMETVISSNKISKNKKDYNPSSEHESFNDSTNSSEPVPDYSELVLIENSPSLANSAAFEKVYGEPLDTSPTESNNITDITPNESYRDANGDKICGGFSS